MKKAIITIILSFVLIIVHGQIKMHSNGQVSFQSTTTNGGVQILTNGISYFEPNITTSATALTQTKALAQLVRAWSVRYDEAPTNVKIRFYVTGIGDTYSNGYYTISPGGGHRKGGCLIENASALISNLNGYYYDNNDFEGFEPDFIDNPNVEPEAVEGLMKMSYTKTYPIRRTLPPQSIAISIPIPQGRPLLCMI